MLFVEDQRLYRDYARRIYWKNAMNDIARINVIVTDSFMVKTEEVADYELFQLISDIGG